MKLVVLGSGTANPHPKRSSAAFWLETAGGIVVLDIAASAPHRLAQEHLDWGNIDAIWISHFHLDHCAGLAPFLFATRHAPETASRTKPLKIFGGKGLRELIDSFNKAGGGKLLEQPFPIEIIETEPLETFEILTGVSAIAMSTPHTDNSHAIRIEDHTGTTLVYTSDTGFRKDVSVFARRADLLIIESSFVRDKKTQKHLELAEAIYLIRQAKPKRAMLTHFYAEWDSVDFKDEIARFDPICDVIEAFDGLRLSIPK
jgi:Metal-dependent hydrolases of the beta-lactamase superfamily III